MPVGQRAPRNRENARSALDCGGEAGAFAHRATKATLKRAVAGPKPQGGVKSVNRRTLQGAFGTSIFRPDNSGRNSVSTQTWVTMRRLGRIHPDKNRRDVCATRTTRYGSLYERGI